jgi:hypothetical protein
MNRIADGVALMLVLAACGSPASNDDTTTSSSPVATTVDSVSPDPSSSETTRPTDGEGVDPGLKSPVESAVVDLADRLGVDQTEVEVVAAYLVTWSDSSLGCPHPDMSYAQVLTDGAVIELGVGETVYNYHMGGSQHTPFLCEEPSPPVTQQKGTGSTLPGPIELNPPSPTEESIPPPGYDE